MVCNRVWATALSAVAVACCGALVPLANDPLFGGFFGLVAIACISCVWYQSWKSSIACALPKEQPKGNATTVEAIDRVLGGRALDASSLPADVAEAVQRVKDQLDLLNSEISDMSPSDAVTSLAKEEVFNNVLWREFSRATRYKTSMSLALIEIEGFEDLAAREGRESGEALTRHVASVILQMVRETDLAARYGQDTFAVIMPETGQQGAQEFATRLSRAVKETEFRINGGAMRVSVLVGVSSVPSERIKTAPELVEQAAAALTSSRTKG
jgi:diguanylate cyclase (GGDEF)-like protein